MKKITLLACLILLFGCSEGKNKECKKFNFSESDTEISKIILHKKKEGIKKIFNQKEVDSILSSLKNSCQVMLKFSSNETMYFYKKDSLVFSIFFNENYFKYKGTTFEFKK